MSPTESSPWGLFFTTPALCYDFTNAKFYDCISRWNVLVFFSWKKVSTLMITLLSVASVVNIELQSLETASWSETANWMGLWGFQALWYCLSVVVWRKMPGRLIDLLQAVSSHFSLPQSGIGSCIPVRGLSAREPISDWLLIHADPFGKLFSRVSRS